MNKKLRVLMLSLFVVLFAAASSFAAPATFDSFDVKVSADIAPATTEGYNLSLIHI